MTFADNEEAPPITGVGVLHKLGQRIGVQSDVNGRQLRPHAPHAAPMELGVG